MKKSKSPLVSIIIPTFNNQGYLKNCLKSVLAHTKVSFEVIVVKGGPKKKNASKIKFKNIRLIDLEKDVGPAKKRNAAARQSLGRYLVFLDDDTLVDRQWLIKTVNFLEKNKDIGAGQLKILKMGQKDHFDSAGEKLTGFGFLSERAREAQDQGQFDQVENIFSGKTAAMIIRKNVFKKAGGFDEDYFMYWEEPDLCWRVWKLGYRVVFLPMGTVWHAYGIKNKKISPDQSAKITFWGCRNQLSTIIKNGVGLQLFKMLAAAALSWLILLFFFLAKADLRKAKAVIQAFSQLIKNIPQLLKKRAELKRRLGKNFFSDKSWFDKIEEKRPLPWYLGKAISYLLGKPF